MMNICALIISLLAFVLSVFQFVRDSLWQKKEATLNAYNELQDDVFSELTTYSKPISEIKRGDDKWNKFTIFLAKLERFSVGINTGIYSIKILNDLGGDYYIYEYEKTVNRLKRYKSTSKYLKRVLLLLKWQFKNDI